MLSSWGNSRNGRKHSLVQAEEDVGEERGAVWLGERLHEAELSEVAEEGVSGPREGQRVSPEEPLESDDGHGEHGEEDELESRLSAREAAVEETHAGDHEQHQDRRYG